MPTPSAITGSVATFTPRPRATISASASSEVSTSGSTATTTARQLRKVMKHSNDTAAYTRNSICRQAACTTALVAASMPAEPAASWNFTSALSFSAAKASTSAVTRVSVSALWSRR